jgi:hypothetical protein
LSCFRPEEDFGQTVSIAGIWLDLTVAVIARKFLWRHLLTTPVATVRRCRSVHHPRCVWSQKPQVQRGRAWRAALAIKVLRLKRNIIIRWRIASRVRASPVRSAGLGLWFDTETKVERAGKRSEKGVPRQNVERNLNSKRMRREFSRYPYHSLSGAISTVQNCARTRRGAMFRFLPPLGR